MTPLISLAVVGLVIVFVAILLAVGYYSENHSEVKKSALRGSHLTLLVDARGHEALIDEWLRAYKMLRLGHADIVFIVRQPGRFKGLAQEGEVAFSHPRKVVNADILRDAYTKSQRGGIVVTMPLHVVPTKPFLMQLVQTVKAQKGRAVYYDISSVSDEMTVSSLTARLSAGITAQLKSIVSMFKSPVITGRSWQAAYHADDFLGSHPLAYYYEARVHAPCSESTTKAHGIGLMVTGLIVITTLLLAVMGIVLPLILAWVLCMIAAVVAFLLSLRGRDWWSLLAMPAFYFLIVPVQLIKDLHAKR